jgi:hypothetical protein
MKLSVLFGIVAIVLFSCGSKDEQFCECMKVGEEFNQTSKEILVKGESSKLVAKFKALKSKKEKVCKKYETMGGKEMLERKAECAE